VRGKGVTYIGVRIGKQPTKKGERVESDTIKFKHYDSMKFLREDVNSEAKEILRITLL